MFLLRRLSFSSAFALVFHIFPAPLLSPTHISLKCDSWGCIFSVTLTIDSNGQKKAPQKKLTFQNSMHRLLIRRLTVDGLNYNFAHLSSCLNCKGITKREKKKHDGRVCVCLCVCELKPTQGPLWSESGLYSPWAWLVKATSDSDLDIVHTRTCLHAHTHTHALKHSACWTTKTTNFFQWAI